MSVRGHCDGGVRRDDEVHNGLNLLRSADHEVSAGGQVHEHQMGHLLVDALVAVELHDVGLVQIVVLRRCVQRLERPSIILLLVRADELFDDFGRLDVPGSHPLGHRRQKHHLIVTAGALREEHRLLDHVHQRGSRSSSSDRGGVRRLVELLL